MFEKLDTAFTRREFLKSAAIAGLGLTLPAFLTRSVAAAMPHPEAIPGFKDDRILVVIQLGGGNDGLNTVVPFGDDAYYRARPALGRKADSLLRINDFVGLNGSMPELKQLYDEGALAIVHGVGYPNPDRSHFRSMEIWQTGVDSNIVSDTGWVGRYFDNCCSGKPHASAGVNVGGEFPQAFSGRTGIGVSFKQPEDFRWLNPGQSRTEFDRLNLTAQAHSPDGDTLDFLRHTAANAVISSDRVTKAGAAPRRSGTSYPGNAKLASSLKTIATLIAGGLPTRLYYTSLTGFDTHANQQQAHERLLADFSGSLGAFLKDLKAIGAADRVLVMAFSEFGRRVTENASGGTDHGTAGPMFLAGAGVRPGLHAKHPSLTDLDDGDLQHTVDFRSVYGEVLTNWFGVDPSKVLGRAFAPINVVKA